MPKLSEGDSKNFNTLQRAFVTGQVALMDVQRVSDGKSVAAIVTVHTDDDGMINMTPFAIMVEGNPFELFRPPDSDSADGYAAI
jgi:hypothetical protein